MIIFDEKLYAEEMLKKGFKTKHKNVNELKILAKYYFYKELEQNDVKKKIKEFCERHVNQYNNDEWYKIINNTVIAAKNKPLITGKTVEITQSELEAIKKLEKINEQLVAFTLLVLYKFYDQRKFEISIEDLYRLCKLDSKINSQTKLKILQVLTKNELIDINMKGERWVTFANDETETKISISDFNNYIYEYLYLIDENTYCLCTTCSKAIKKTSNRKKYCTLCWNSKKRELWRENKRKQRKMS